MMRSRQNGGSYELLCSVCDQPYAELFPVAGRSKLVGPCSELRV